MDSALRPKDIQARIRAGEPAEQVADAAQVPVERIMVYVLPVLAEREHVARLAQEAAVRRRHVGGPPRLLGDAVAGQLRAEGVDSDAVTWDARRRDDGRWTVTAQPRADRPTGTFVFDLPGRYALAADDAGQALVGDVPPPQPAEEPVAVAEGTGEDTDAVAGADPDADTGGDAGVRRIDETLEMPAIEAEPPTASTSVGEPLSGEPPVEHTAVQRSTRNPDDHRAAAEEQLPLEGVGDTGSEDSADPGAGSPARRRRERKRSSVPSWDEIMFGGRRDG